ncbi:hypothetical protein [Geothermobacter hydrogeniphilus]|uniref:Uncharacterized protein n=1 Tax=Geothermobacter hydrogeniphilus TaxID=1969733 RepID=A0A1X0XW27_9BACT|nr:hypothetical protein [Geothermobacter hydrogeniphilus]ORJ57090.1 hypothetical protein B5V00_14235 [Geothermobacter hydrogeniphilus]
MIRIVTLLSVLLTLICAGSSAALAAADKPASSPEPAVAPPPAAVDTPVPTQRDWLKNLIEGLGWGFGLPDEPEDADYLAIVSGKRRFRIEAEQAVPPTEPVSVKNLHSYGPFSGRGWVSGISTPTTARLSFLLPIGGRYRVSVALRLPGHQLTIGGQQFKADGGEHFRQVELGDIELTAGQQKISVALPPDGGIDYIELKASNLTPIEPPGGWQLDRPLTPEVLAVTTIQLLDLLDDLPPLGKEIRVEAEQMTLPASAEKTGARHLGAPSGQAWVRAGAAGSKLSLTFTPPAAGVYRLALRAMVGASIKTMLDDSYQLNWDFPPYLATRQGPSFFLAGRPHRLDLVLPPRAGVDALILTPLASSGEDFLNLSGLRSLGETIHFADLDRLLPLLALLVNPR